MPAAPAPPSEVPFAVDGVDRAAYAVLRETCLRHGLLPAFSHGIVLDLAMVAPDDAAAVAEVRRLTHQEVRCFGIAEEDFDRAVSVLEPCAASVPGAADPAPSVPPGCPQSWDLHRRTPREVAAEMVRYAFLSGASDLLLDEQAAWMDVAIKRDGRKEIIPPVDKALAPGLLKAFKEMCGLSTQTVTAAQSGAASLAVAPGARAELRVEVTPTVHGESLVARVQDRERQLRRMRRLPFTAPEHLRIASACLRQPQGLLLVTGPTGHGKTTTLYACLGQLDPAVLNIRTLEDPVEFTVPWITQIPVGEGTGRGFSAGLKSLLRQAPHVILLGEIREAGAAATCVEAVETGHLILATLHTRDAVGVVARLLDLGLTGRQLAAALRLAVGQRLVRRLCPHCRRLAPPSPGQRRHFEHHRLPVPPALGLPGGCNQCAHRGESGLAPVFEFFAPGESPAVEEALALAERSSYSERALRQRWIEGGGSPLVREGLRLVAAGEVAYAEVLGFEADPQAAAFGG
jgi:type II secretory ATPase GspE/PulE/Tfp pilus assembly ATPase PilB-like protein